jgi:hypothetical protein
MATMDVGDLVAPPVTIEPWVFRELGQANFGDARLTGRVLTLANDLAAHPNLSLASTYEGDWASLKASYRFLDNAAVTPDAIVAPHRDATWDRSGQESWVLIAQDTSYFNYTGHPATQGLGPIERVDDPGLLVHTALAMTEQGVPLGIAAQKIWTRDPAHFGKSRQRKTRPFAEKESARWVEIAKEATRGVPDGTRAVVIGDRESDMYDVFVDAESAPYDVLVRSARDRRVAHPTEDYLWRAVEAAEVLGTFVIDVPRKEDHPVRQATLTLQTTTVQLQIPHGREADGLGTPTVQIVLAKEVDPPADTPPIVWILLTTLSVVTFEDARCLVRWYTYRWRIERFHFVLKTGGSNVEKLQLETYDRLARAIALYSIIAWHILWMTYQVRLQSDQPCSIAFTAEEEHALRGLYERQRPRKGPRSGPYDPHYRLTLREAMHTMAKLGGFIGRKGDGDPGIRTLWQGYRELQLILLGMRLAKADQP